MLEKMEAERDESQTKVQNRSHAGSDGDGQRDCGVGKQGENEGGMIGITGDSTSVWSSMDLEINHTHKGINCAGNTSDTSLLWLKIVSMFLTCDRIASDFELINYVIHHFKCPCFSLVSQPFTTVLPAVKNPEENIINLNFDSYNFLV